MDRIASKKSTESPSARRAEALLPHLIASLSMGWDSPPEYIAERLNSAFPATTPDEARTMNVAAPESEGETKRQAWIKQRCGHLPLEHLNRNVHPRAPSLEAMIGVQETMLKSRPIRFRSTVAFTSVRDERYAYFDGIEEMFRRKIDADMADRCHPMIKAMRLYLDILFFHPFPDGNARAATLWSAYLCRINGIHAPHFRDIERFPLLPGNRHCYWSLVDFAIEEPRA